MEKQTVESMMHSGGGIKRNGEWFLYALTSGYYIVSDVVYEPGNDLPEYNQDLLYTTYEEAFRQYVRFVY